MYFPILRSLPTLRCVFQNISSPFFFFKNEQTFPPLKQFHQIRCWIYWYQEKWFHLPPHDQHRAVLFDFLSNCILENALHLVCVVNQRVKFFIIFLELFGDEIEKKVPQFTALFGFFCKILVGLTRWVLDQPTSATIRKNNASFSVEEMPK